MEPHEIENSPPRPRLRHFGWLLALGLVLAAGLLEAGPAALGAEALAALVFAVATIWPGALRGPYRAVATVTTLAGRLRPGRLRKRLTSPSPQSPRAGPPAPAGWRGA
jgi:hypothetical protein